MRAYIGGDDYGDSFKGDTGSLDYGWYACVGH